MEVRMQEKILLEDIIQRFGKKEALKGITYHADGSRNNGHFPDHRIRKEQKT